MTIGSIVLAVGNWTQPRIDWQREQAQFALLQQLLPNHVATTLRLHSTELSVPGQFQTDAPITVHRAIQGDQVLVVIFAYSLHDGYNGDIELLVAINATGQLIGVRVTRHQETPGLGDAIELRNSDWIRQFENLNLGTINARDWQIKRKNGRFDQLTGATITTGAMLRAIRRAADYYLANSDTLLRVPAATVRDNE